jgi:uncharacterized protein
MVDRVSERIPLFPLGTVLYPGLLLPLHIFEDRYRLLVADLIEHRDVDDRFFGVVAIRAGFEVGPAGVLALHDVGCTANLRGVQARDGGEFDIVTAGSRRFRLLAVDDSQPWLEGEVEWLPEPEGAAAQVLARSVKAHFQRYRINLLGSRGISDQNELPDDPETLSYLVAATTLLDLADHQALLQAPDTGTRLRLELTLLRRETALLEHLPTLPAIDLTRAPVSPN